MDTVTANGNTVDYTYDDFGRIQQKVIRSGTEVVLTTTYTYYDPTETTTSTQVKSIQQTAGNYSVTYTYTYDKNGNILLVDNGTATVQYLYTDTNQLYETRDQIAGMIQALRYTDLDRPFVELAVLDGEQTTIEYGWDATWGDMLTRYGDRTLTYDNIGNMTSDGTYTYTWEHGRELSTMADSTGTWAFTYDANGMRTKKVKTNTSGSVTDTYTYVYNGSQLSQMTKNGNVLNFFYDGEGRPAYFTYGSATYYYVTNLQGDVVAILDSTGNVMVNYHYDAYGVLLQTGGTMASTLGTLNPLTYRGYVYDHETGLYYLQSRYYNPIFRQFISPDAFISTGQGFMGYNMFAYCGNNPVRFKDTTGTRYAISERDLLAGSAAACVIFIPNLAAHAERLVKTASIMLSEAISTIAIEISVAIEKAIEEAVARDHSVYVLKDGSETVQYVGRTKHIDKRKTAHKNNRARAGLEFKVVASGLTYLEARALEQAGMAYYHTINTANKMNNQINGIAFQNWEQFKGIAKGTLKYVENQMTNEILYWTEN